MTSQKEPRRWVERNDLEGDPAQAAALLRQVGETRSRPGARARVWSRLQRPARSRRPLAMAAIAGAGLAVILGLALRTLETPVVEVVAGLDRVKVEARAGSEARVVRASHGGASIVIGGLARVDLLPDTELIATTRAHEVAIELIAGGIVATPLEGELATVRVSAQPYSIEGERLEARVVRVGTQDVEVEVIAGDAEVTGPSGGRRLRAGEVFGSAPTTAALTPPPAPAPEPERPPEPPRAKPRRRVRVRTVEPAVVAPNPEAPVPEVTPAIPEGPDWDALYREATETRDPDHAIALFDRLATSGTQWSEVSAFQSARLQMQRGRCAEAIDRLRSLIGGTYDPEVRLDVIECRLQLADLGGAERDLDAFLRIHPDSERQADLRFLRAELARKSDRCADAIPDYESAQSSRRGDDALYFDAWCQLHLGRSAAGVETLQRYLERFPHGRHAGEARKKL